MKVELKLDSLVLDCPDDFGNNGNTDSNANSNNGTTIDHHHDEKALKEWLWSEHRDTILQALTVTRRDDVVQPSGAVTAEQSRNDDHHNTTANNTGNSSSSSSSNNNNALQRIQQEQQQEQEQPSTTSTTSTSIPTANDKFEMLDVISQAQREFLKSESLASAFDCLLTGLLSMAQSGLGFIGEVKYTDDDEENGQMYLQIHSRASVETLDKDPTAKLFFDQLQQQNTANLYNLHSLFGHCLLTKQPILSNNAQTDQRAGGVPPGHPILHSFCGVPFLHHGGRVMGLVGVANKQGGLPYTTDDIQLLQPFCSTCGSILQSFNQIKRNTHLINSLEDQVKERTDKLRSANQELATANKRVLSASAAQLEHFACMSHEIRTPLNCIIGLSSLLQEQDLNPMQDEAVKMIVSSGDLLLTVVNDVLDYSKLESGNVEIRIQRANLQATLNALVHSIAMKARSKNISLRTLFDVALPEFFRTDSRRVQQILFNLLGNAVKFSNEGSVIDLRIALSDGQPPENAYSPSSYVGDKVMNNNNNGVTTTTSADAMRKSNSNNNTTISCIRFTVKDYGKGIAKKDYGRIFEPFRQATYETEKVFGGTGLGLAVTSKLVKGLGGTMYVDSEEGQWSRFTVDLPFNEPPADPAKIGEGLRGVTIFLICNDNAVAAQVGKSFKAYGVDYVRFTSSDEMDSKISCEGFLQRGTTYVYLGQEDLFTEFAYDLLSQLTTHAVLLTFGPNFQIPRTQGHYRSLVQVLPSVLIKSIASYAAKRPGLARSDSFNSYRSAAAGFQEYRILIAEDNKINQKVLIRMLARLGIEDLVVVENGLEAVKAEAAQEFDVCFMDMQMPIMDGLEACEKITDRTTGHRQATVVFVTAHVSPAFERRCEEAGASGYLPKPFNISDIKNCLQSVFTIRDGADAESFSSSDDD